VLHERTRLTCHVLESKKARLQTAQNELQAVQSLILRLSSVLVDLQSWRIASLMQGINISENSQHFTTKVESSQEMPILQAQGSLIEDMPTQLLLAQQCADLAVFTVFGGHIQGESRMKFFNSLNGM